MKNKRFYNFSIVIYEDDENFSTQKFNLNQEGDVIFCRHDHDVFEEDVLNEDGTTKHESGEIKKPHFHYVLKLKNACTISSLAKRTGIPENMIEPVKKSLNGCLRYLIHFGSDNKYQYSVDDVESNSDKLLRKFLDLVSKDTPEVDKVITIQDFIENCNTYVDLGILMKFVQKENIWDAFRRNYMIIRDLVNNHNAMISAERYNHDNSYYTEINNKNWDF